MKRPTFHKLIPLFEANEDFSITENQYFKSTGVTLPKNYYYLKNKSALSKIAKEKGYIIDVAEKTVCFKKIF